MKQSIHPAYQQITVTCACGHAFKTGSTLGSDLHVEVCANDHPFYTGTQRRLDSGGRIERFRRLYGAGANARAAGGVQT